MEVVYQVALQILVLLLSKTETATTSGLQTFFEQTSALGIDSTVILREVLKSNILNLLSFLLIFLLSKDISLEQLKPILIQITKCTQAF